MGVELRKKILFLHAGAELYGADKVLLTLLKDLDKDVYKPIVLLPNDGPLVDELNKNNVEVIVLNYPILRRKYFNLIGIIKFPFQYLWFSHKISNIVRSRRISIVHVNTTAVLEGVYLKIINNVPLVWHVHEIILKPKFVFKLTRYLIKKYSNRVIVVSQAVRKHLNYDQTIDNSLVTTVYNGVSSKKKESLRHNYLRKELNIPLDAYVIGMVGRINSWKGQKDFVDAISKLIDKDKNVYGLIVGGTFEGEEWRKKELEELIQSKKVDKRIILIDFTSDIEKVYLAIDLFVLPSTNPDPLPTVVLEAMSYALPVIGYSHGGIKEMICEPEQNLAPPQNYDKLGELMERYSQSKSRSLELGRLNQKRQNEVFNRDDYSKKIAQIYKVVSRG